MRRARVFLSYARNDGAEACDFFDRALSQAEFHIWRDLADIAGGADWRVEAREAIRSVDIVLLFLTPGAVASENMKWEWNTALDLGKRVVPLVIQDCSLPAELAGNRNHRDLRSGYQQEPFRIIGECQREWQRIRSRLQNLSESFQEMFGDSPHRSWLRIGEKSLDQKLRSDPPLFPPEVFDTFLDLLKWLAGQSAAQVDLSDALDCIFDGRCEVAGSKAIVQAHADTFRRVLKPMRDQLPGIAVPTVLMVMNRQEAESLADGTAFANYPRELREEFDAFRAGLPDGWILRYGERPEQARLFPTQPSAIGQLIRSTLEGQCSEPLVPHILDVRRLSAGSMAQLWELRNKGCVVVIDALSTRHPALQRCFRRTRLDSSPKTLVVKISPSPKSAAVIDTLGALVEEWFASEFDRRMQEDDFRVADVTEWSAFRRFVRNEVPRSIPKCAGTRDNIWGAINQVST
jgi:hypothetical protein